MAAPPAGPAIGPGCMEMLLTVMRSPALHPAAPAGNGVSRPLRRRSVFRRRARGARLVLAAAAAMGALAAGAGDALADLRLCNMTGSRVGVALGYRDGQGWVTEGWWNLEARRCETLLKGALASRFYYVYAVDYDRGGDWSGKAYMCTRDREFSIRGVENCLARGYDRNGFFEVDTGEQKSWTIQLTDTPRTPEKSR